jgi:hypothetical protein
MLISRSRRCEVLGVVIRYSRERLLLGMGNGNRQDRQRYWHQIGLCVLGLDGGGIAER